MAIVNFRGDKLYHEHIYWDQASVLVQIGKLDEKGLPVAGGAEEAAAPAPAVEVAPEPEPPADATEPVSEANTA